MRASARPLPRALAAPHRARSGAPKQLDGEARKARWGAGEKEAMDAALLEHGKDPVVVADNAFREKPRGEVVRMYFECDAWRRYQAAQAANAPPEPDPPEKKSKKQKT